MIRKTSSTRRKYLKTLLIISLPVLILAVIGVGVVRQKSSYSDSFFSNTHERSISYTVIKNTEDKIDSLMPDSAITVNSEKIPVCSEDKEGICYSSEIETDFYAHYQILNLEPSTEYSIGWYDTYFNRVDSEKRVTTAPLDESPPQLARVYGKIINNNEIGIGNSLVYVEPVADSSQEIPVISDITVDNGTYQMTYPESYEKGFLQRVRVVTPDGEKIEYMTSSNNNKPIADIEVTDNGGSSLAHSQRTGNVSSLVNRTEAKNSCVSGTKMAGIRVQCDINVDWMSDINPNNCPDPSKFRLGLIKHTNTTKFHKEDEIIMRLVEADTGAVVAEVNNGGYVSTALLEEGKTYHVKAFDGAEECTNGSPGENKTVDVVLAEKTEEYETVDIGPSTQQVNLCEKMGENFATPFELPVDKMQEAVDNRMRWGEGIAVTYGDITGPYRETVIKADKNGLTPILRICYKGSCDINDGTQYARKVIEVYNGLVDSGKLPQNGLYVHAGHNEPNEAEYRDPAEEAQFVAEFVTTLSEAGYISMNPNDAGIKILSPNFDLYSGGGSSAKDYLDQMLQNPGFNEIKGEIYGWAVNDYVVDRGFSVPGDVNGFIDHLNSKGLRTNIFITELGKINRSASWDEFATMVGELESNSNVKAILMFNSLGTNKDPNFEYHQDLWNGSVDVTSLFQSCTMADYQVPQEGSPAAEVDSSVELDRGQDGGNGKGNPAQIAQPVPVVDDRSPGESGGSSSPSGSLCVNISGREYPIAEGRGPSSAHPCAIDVNMPAGLPIEIPGFQCEETYAWIENNTCSAKFTNGSEDLFVAHIQYGDVGKRTCPTSCSEVRSGLSGTGWPHAHIAFKTAEDFGVSSSTAQPEDLQSPFRGPDCPSSGDISYCDLDPGNCFPCGNVSSSVGENSEGLIATDIASESVVLGANTDSVKPPSFEERGVYRVTSDKYQVVREELAVLEHESTPGADTATEFIPFYDTNENGVHDEGEDYIVDYDSFNFEKIRDLRVVELEPGLNLVTMPLYTEDLSSAIKLVQDVDSQGAEANALGVYHNTRSRDGWQFVNNRGAENYGDDFRIEPGKGVYINVNSDSKFYIDGAQYTSAVEVYLRKGWNLAALNGTEQSYFAGDILSELENLSGVRVTKVAIWDSKRGKYQLYVVDNSQDTEELFGEDFEIKDSQAFFLFVEEGVDYWTPGER